MSAHFDWYEASLDGLKTSDLVLRSRLQDKIDPDAAAAWVFAREFLQEIANDDKFDTEMKSHGWRFDDFERVQERGFNHYRSCLTCYTPERVALFRLLWSPGSSLHIICSGKRSPVLSAALRRLVPLHYVTRADSALDFGEFGAWDRLVKLSEELRDGVFFGNKPTSTQILQDEETGGKTYYLGSLKSPAFMRIYDKSVEQRLKTPAHMHDQIPALWTRAEVVSRPAEKEQRLFLSRCEPADVWSAGAVIRKFYESICAGEIGEMPKESPKVEDFNKAYWTALYQYKRTWEWALKQSGGDIHAFGEKIVNDLMSAGLM